jgi:hypothetical protein
VTRAGPIRLAVRVASILEDLGIAHVLARQLNGR